MDLTPRLSGENSIITALATAGLVFGVYQAKVGPVSDVHATEAFDGNMQASVKKAGWTSLALVAGITLLARDPNLLILGGAAIIAEELTYRHALMTNPQTGNIQLTPAAYAPAGPGGAPANPFAAAIPG